MYFVKLFSFISQKYSSRLKRISLSFLWEANKNIYLHDYANFATSNQPGAHLVCIFSFLFGLDKYLSARIPQGMLLSACFFAPI